MFLPAELRRGTKALHFDVHYKDVCQTFDRGCRFLQDAHNSAVFNMAPQLHKPLHNFHCYEYYLDSLLQVYNVANPHRLHFLATCSSTESRIRV